MQFELPVVATDLGGPAEVVPQEKCLCDPANPHDLAKTIVDVYPERAEIGEENKRHVMETYAPEKVLPKIIDIYRDILPRQGTVS